MRHRLVNGFGVQIFPLRPLRIFNIEMQNNASYSVVQVLAMRHLAQQLSPRPRPAPADNARACAPRCKPRPKFICLRGELGAYMRHLWGAFWPRAAAAFPYLPIERLGRGVQGRRSSRAGVQRLAVEEWGRTWFFKIMHWDHRQRVAILMGGLRCTQRPCSHAPPPPPPPPPPRRARRLTPDAVLIIRLSVTEQYFGSGTSWYPNARSD
jgi:hypothetical protein